MEAAVAKAEACRDWVPLVPADDAVVSRLQHEVWPLSRRGEVTEPTHAPAETRWRNVDHAVCPKPPLFCPAQHHSPIAMSDWSELGARGKRQGIHKRGKSRAPNFRKTPRRWLDKRSMGSEFRHRRSPPDKVCRSSARTLRKISHTS
ncbi:hypothetical protein GCM10009693_10370 [Leucobacter chromiireducens subsp. chromiireducens]